RPSQQPVQQVPDQSLGQQVQQIPKQSLGAQTTARVREMATPQYQSSNLVESGRQFAQPQLQQLQARQPQLGQQQIGLTGFEQPQYGVQTAQPTQQTAQGISTIVPGRQARQLTGQQPIQQIPNRQFAESVQQLPQQQFAQQAQQIPRQQYGQILARQPTETVAGYGSVSGPSYGASEQFAVGGGLSQYSQAPTMQQDLSGQPIRQYEQQAITPETTRQIGLEAGVGRSDLSQQQVGFEPGMASTAASTAQQTSTVTPAAGAGMVAGGSPNVGAESSMANQFEANGPGAM
ncbi:MAG: hypothetical protein ABEI99_10665, partial [Halobaculum sp.]